MAGIGLVLVGLAVLAMHQTGWFADFRPDQVLTRNDLRIPLALVAIAEALTVRVAVPFRSGRFGTRRITLDVVVWAALLPITDPLTFVLGVTAGTAAAQAYDRLAWTRNLFNTAFVFGTAAAYTTVFRLLAPGDLAGPLGWMAVLVAMVAMTIVQLGILESVTGTATDRHVTTASVVMTSTMTAGMSLAAIIALELVLQDVRAWILALPLMVAVSGGVRSLARRGVLVDDLGDTVDELQLAAITDRLTGLPNRSGLRLHANQLEDPEDHVLLLVDIKDFRATNESLGFAVGDGLLRDVGRRLRDAARPGEVVARLSADEFAVLACLREDLDGFDASREQLDSETLDELLQRQARRFLDCLDAPHRAAAEGSTATVLVQIFASVGAVPVTQPIRTSQLVQRAEVALREARRSGADIAVYDEASHDQRGPTRRMWVAAELRRAISEDHVTLAYQPKLDLRTGEIIAVEALARWTHETDGPISPGEFIPIAEQTGLIRALTRQLLVHALTDLAALHEIGVRIGLSFNVDAVVLSDREFASFVAAEVLRAKVEPEDLTLEITETTVLTEAAIVSGALGDLADFGVRLSIDDFGTGYSSLTHLRRLKAHEIKIDRSFVGGMLDDPEDAVLVDSTIKLGHALGLLVVAEGVEDEVTLERLRALACDEAQGFHIARPMPLDDLVRSVRDARPMDVP